MAVPDYIRKVPRPVNTIVEDNSRDGPNRFAVRERISTRCIPRGNPQPRNGMVIEHIRNGKYVPKQEPVNSGVPDMLTFEGIFEEIGDHVLYKKACIKGGRYLYAYRSARKAAIEEADYLARREKNKDFMSGKYENEHSIFGVIVFESDLDMDPKTAYLCYDERWMLKLVFCQYKNDQCLDRTNVQGDFSLMGSEFINFIATVATCRLIARAREAGLLNRMSYKGLMDDLSSAWRMADSPEPPRSDDGCWVHTITSVFEELEALDLSTSVSGSEAMKRGRPKKEPQEQKPKRPRGCPRKNP